MSNIIELFKSTANCFSMNEAQEGEKDQNGWISLIALGIIVALGAASYFSRRENRASSSSALVPCVGAAVSDVTKITFRELVRELETLDNDALHGILELLPEETLSAFARVSPHLEYMGNDPILWRGSALKDRFPLLKNIFDKEAWGRIVNLNTLDGVSFEGEEEFSLRSAVDALRDIHHLKVEGDAGYTIITMPRGMTINKLKALIARFVAEGKFPGNARQRNPGFTFFWNHISEVYGNIFVDKPYTFVISNFVQEGSRGKSYNVQRASVTAAGGCELPQVLEAMTLLFLTYVASGERQESLYGDAPRTFTRCLERINNNVLAIGVFTSAGLIVYDCFAIDSFGGAGGAGGARKFF